MSTDAASPIRIIRRQRGLTAEQLAARAGLASATVYRAERGIGTPSAETIEAMAAVLEVDPVALHGVDAAIPADGRGHDGSITNDQAPLAVSAKSSASGAG